MMFTKEVMEQFTELDFAVYDCIVKHKKKVILSCIVEDLPAFEE